MDLKERERATWARVAPGWARHDERMTAQGVVLTPRLLDAAGIAPGMRVLDIASGTGQPALPAAQRVGPTGRVLGTDLVEEMVAFARAKAAWLGLDNVEFRRVDGEELDVPVGAFDAVTMRWGLMFMPDALACLRRAHAALRPGGRIALTTWASVERNPWAGIPMRVIGSYVEIPAQPPGAPGLFAYADPARLRGVLADAGFRDIAVDDVDVVVGGEFESGAHWVEYCMDLAGPLARLAAALPEEKQAALRAEMAREAEAFSGGTRVALPGVTWLASAVR